jgi:hypothetical protein
MEANETNQPSWMSHAIKYGVVLSVISMVVVLLLYAVDYTIMATLGFVGIVMLIGIGFVIYAGINYRKSIGGFIPYGQAFLHGLVLLGVSGFISMLFNLVLYNLIDPELPQKLTEIIISNTEAMMAKWNAPQGQIDEKIAEMTVDIPYGFTTVGLLVGYCKAYIGYVIISLITALIVKKNKPEMI